MKVGKEQEEEEEEEEETGNDTLTRYFSLRSSSLLVKDAFKSPCERLLRSFLREFLSILREEEEEEGEEKEGMDLAEEDNMPFSLIAATLGRGEGEEMVAFPFHRHMSSVRGCGAVRGKP